MFKISLLLFLSLISCDSPPTKDSLNSSTSIDDNTSIVILDTSESSGSNNSYNSDESTSFKFDVGFIESDLGFYSTSSESESSESGEEYIPECGNSILDENEECDDGNQIDEDTCSNNCFKFRIVFVTKNIYSGNLGGISKAHELCQLESDSKNYKAFLADSISSPFKEIKSDFKGWYKTPSGNLVSRGWDKLIDKGIDFLDSPINEHFDGTYDTFLVWSNVDAHTGDTYSNSYHCYNWTNETSEIFGRAGIAGAIDFQWVEYSKPISCNEQLALYCFQVK